MKRNLTRLSLFSFAVWALAAVPALAQTAPAAAASLAGEWRGAITGGQTRVFTLTIKESAGTLSGELSAMGGKAPMSGLKFAADKSVTFEIPNVMKFAGKATITEGTMLSTQGDWMSGDVTATGLQGKWIAHKIKSGGPELATAAEYTARGSSHSAKRAFAEAIGDFTRSLSRQPSTPVYVMRAGTYYRQATVQKESNQNMNAALEGFLGQKVKVDSTFAELSLELAIDDLTQALKLNANSSSAYNVRGLVWMEKCELSGRLADCGKAVDDFTRSIELSPITALLYENRSKAYKKLGKTAEAAADDRKALELKAGQ